MLLKAKSLRDPRDAAGPTHKTPTGVVHKVSDAKKLRDEARYKEKQLTWIWKRVSQEEYNRLWWEVEVGSRQSEGGSDRELRANLTHPSRCQALASPQGESVTRWFRYVDRR